jgi:hypothetical protein
MCAKVITLLGDYIDCIEKVFCIFCLALLFVMKSIILASTSHFKWMINERQAANFLSDS